MMNIHPTESRLQFNAPPSPINFPHELMTEVISFLTVKSLMRLRCLSKSFNSLISDPTFVQMHLKRSARNTHIALISSESKYEGDYSVVLIPVRRLLEKPSIADDPHHRLKDKDCHWVVGGSCNGLLCLLGYSKTNEYRDMWLCFWNPATNKRSGKLGYFRHYVTPESSYFKFTFGYDNSTGTYKVVALRLDGGYHDQLRTEVRVFSLGDNVWRKIQNSPAAPLQWHCIRPMVNDGVYLRGSINWLALRNNFSYDWKDLTVELFVIVSLDLGTETYTQLLLPRDFDEVPCFHPTVSVLMDCLCFSHDSDRIYFVLWKMTEFGVEQSWTQFLKISYNNLQIRHDRFVGFEYSQWFPLYLFENQDTLILGSNKKRQVILYNWRDERVERTRITDGIRRFFAMDYVESLVSPC